MSLRKERNSYWERKRKNWGGGRDGVWLGGGDAGGGGNGDGVVGGEVLL